MPWMPSCRPLDQAHHWSSGSSPLEPTVRIDVMLLLGISMIRIIPELSICLHLQLYSVIFSCSSPFHPSSNCRSCISLGFLLPLSHQGFVQTGVPLKSTVWSHLPGLIPPCCDKPGQAFGSSPRSSCKNTAAINPLPTKLERSKQHYTTTYYTAYITLYNDEYYRLCTYIMYYIYSNT